MTLETAVTKEVTFRFGKTDFKIQLNFSNEKTKKASTILEASTSFFNFLKEIKIIDDSEEIQQWIKSGNTTFVFPDSDNVTSLKIRKKAYNLGLTVIPGEVFTKNRKESYEKALDKKNLLTNS